MVSGVAQVQVYGSQKYAVRVQLDPNRSPRAASASTRSQQAIAQRQRQPADRHALRAATRRLRVQATGQLTDAAAYAPLIVAYRNGAPVRLDDSAA